MTSSKTPCCGIAGLVTPQFFKALADPTRLAILASLAECCGKPKTVNDIAAGFSVDLSVVSRHLAVLKAAGMVEARRQGRSTYYHCSYERLVSALRSVADAIESCCPRDGSSVSQEFS